jgi:hypothetical protein
MRSSKRHGHVPLVCTITAFCFQRLISCALHHSMRGSAFIHWRRLNHLFHHDMFTSSFQVDYTRLCLEARLQRGKRCVLLLYDTCTGLYAFVYLTSHETNRRFWDDTIEIWVSFFTFDLRERELVDSSIWSNDHWTFGAHIRVTYHSGGAFVSSCTCCTDGNVLR